ncbi:hypothetical protein GMORB2_7677 [Geosmithia morbida]|uniref:BZIP domain-containing protein n=1 Tax=Geosmithia morbida TaxID=1094350 RepID=A0A9P4YW25_9HYPO|nr:uncharacterized protein GMORB2_7677 [Geosmithia morbida]KAF4122084.1 hypothetical protein GMORB2_7677 [Geosmithia morbida]
MMRRRKQIREAQRAYRNRKDKAITDLEEKVKRLEETCTTMTRDFSSFIDLLHSHGAVSANSELSLRLDELSKKFFSAPSSTAAMQVQAQVQAQPQASTAMGTVFREGDVHSVASSTAGGGGGGVGDKLASHPPRHNRRPTMGTISSASSDNFAAMPQRHSLGIVHSFPSSATDFFPPDPFAYEVITQPTPENASFPSYTPDPQAPSGWVEQPAITQALAPPPQALATDMATSVAPHQYAPLEQSFSRRLQHAMLQRMLMLATMANPSPGKFSAVFDTEFMFESRDSIIYRLTEQMQSLARGGRPGGDNAMSHGVRFDKGIQMTYPSSDGVFLDTEEVENYLGQRGVRIPGSADFIDVELSPHDFGGGPAAEGGNTSMFGDGSMGRGSGAGASTGTMNAFLYPGATNVPVGSSSSWTSSQSPGRLKVTLNVGLLVEQMVNKAVFLGKTPGIRPSDVDISVKVATGLYQH